MERFFIGCLCLFLIISGGCAVTDPEIPDGHSSYEKGNAPKAHLGVVEPDVYQVTFDLEVESTGNRRLMQLRACYSETNEKPDTTDRVTDLFPYYREGEPHLPLTLAGLEPETEYHCRLYVANTDSGCYTNSITCMTKAPVGNSSWRAVAGIPWLTERYTGGFTVGDRYFALSSRVFPDGRARLIEYLPDSDEWAERSGLPFGSRVQPVAVEAGGKGYAGLGDIEEPNETGGFAYYAQRDWWCYDPIANRWERKADIPVGTTGLMAAFGVDGKVYVVTSPDFWNSTPTYVLEYDTRSDRWSRKRDFPGDKLQEATSMVVDGRPFLFTGITNRMQEGGNVDENEIEYLSAVWEYDVPTDTWFRRSDFKGGGRARMVAVAAGGNGYAGFGVKPVTDTYSVPVVDWWMYDPVADRWSRKGVLADWLSMRPELAFSVKGHIYVGSTYEGVWEYLPDKDR